MKTSPLRVAISLCLLGIVIAVLDVTASGMSGNSAGERDFIAYWAAGQQLAHGANPYDGAAVLKLENAAGLSGNRPNLMLNLPIAFFVAWPLGFVSAKTGLVLWTMAIVASLMGSIRMLWILMGRREGRLHLLSYLFAPVLACLMAGQLGTFMLLGVVVFLYFQQSRPMLAGAALVLCALKPHLFVPLGIVILVWALDRKAYRLLAGIAAATGACCAFSLLVDRHSWSQYAWMMKSTAEVRDAFIPTLSMVFRMVVNRNAVWLQFVPVLLGSIWALWYYSRNRRRWSWMDQGALVLLVSEACAPHAWFTDEAILLPAILIALYRAEESGPALWAFAVLAGAALAETMTQVPIITPFYLWTVPAWLGWYLFATRSRGAAASEAQSDGAAQTG